MTAIYIKGWLDIVVSSEWVMVGNQKGGNKRTGGLGDQTVGVMASAISLSQ